MTRIAASTGHPVSTEIALAVGREGGNAVDAAIAAQVAVGILLPQAAGIGGDSLTIVDDGGSSLAINGTGRSPAIWPDPDLARAGNQVTVPGAVSGWFALHERFGTVPMARLLEPAARLCREGMAIDAELMTAIDAQRARIARVSPEDPLLGMAVGDVWRQEALGDLVEAIGADGPRAFYDGAAARAIEGAIAARGGSLSVEDLAGQEPEIGPPLSTGWDGGTVAVQPPMTQGVLLAAALHWLDSRFAEVHPEDRDHVLAELTGAVFEWRDDCALGEALLQRPIEIDLGRATPRSGPRSYLHTTGVAVADEDGLVVSSLVSVFDLFGSAILVPELGIRLNSRAGGFTAGRNALAPGARPVHTLAPALVRRPDGTRYAIATPGADGQVQTLLQVLVAARAGADPDEAIARARWRSQDGELVIPDDHPSAADLAGRGHRLRHAPTGADIFGAVVSAGIGADGLFARGDWRRQVGTAVAP